MLSTNIREVHFEYLKHRKYRRETQSHQVSYINQFPFNLETNILADIKDHSIFVSEPFLNIPKCGIVHLKVSHLGFLLAFH